MKVTGEERGIMEHACGWNAKNRLYRNRYVIGPDCDNWGVVQSLVERGLMSVALPADADLGGMTVFSVTSTGLQLLELMEAE